MHLRSRKAARQAPCSLGDLPLDLVTFDFAFHTWHAPKRCMHAHVLVLARRCWTSLGAARPRPGSRSPSQRPTGRIWHLRVCPAAAR